MNYEDQYYEEDEQFSNGLVKVLMVAEKNSIAEAIAYAIGGKPRANKGKMAMFHFEGKFKGQPASFTVTATNGHLYNRDFPQEYSDWKKVDPIELFNAKTIRKPSNAAAVGLLGKISKNLDYLVLWLDNDREGENICFEVNDICNPNGKAKVLRAKFSSITSNDLKTAYSNLNYGPNLAESQSVDARQIIDLKIGVSFSRFQTMHFNRKYSNDQLVTFGPCQTPTLGFCVARVEEIENFVPRTYYRLNMTIQSETGFKQDVEWLGEHIWKDQEAKALVLELSKEKFGEVIQSTTNQKSKPSPEGVNTVTMLKFASSCLGLGPQQTMHMAERLYLSGYISYPRTESTAFPAGFPTKNIIKNLSQLQDKEIQKHCQLLLGQGISNPKKGTDHGDHPPITPTEQICNELHGIERGLYDYIVKMFLASHSGDCKYQHTTLKFKVKGEQFKFSSNKVVDPGYTGIATWLKLAENNIDPKKYIVNNNQVRIGCIEQQIGQTKPPDFLTETELISLMDKFRIGTDASMATHINNICERLYVRVEGGSRKLVPTELGLSLVRGYKKIDPDLVAPQLRSNIENQVDQIAKGKARFEDVVQNVIQIFLEKYKRFREKINDMELSHMSKPQSGHQKVVEEEKSLTKCGICSRFMTLLRSSLKCETCDKTYKLLPEAKYRAVGNQLCPLDKFQLVFCQSNKSPFISTYLCPKCYSDSPIIQSDQCVCNLCPHKDCQNSLVSRKMGQCPHCKVGDLLLEPFITKGQQITISCNECWCLYQMVPFAMNVSVSKQLCNCQLLKLTIEFKDKETYKLNEPICILCHPDIKLKMLFAQYGYEKRFVVQKREEPPVKASEQRHQNRGGPKPNRKQFQKREREPLESQQHRSELTLADYLSPLLKK